MKKILHAVDIHAPRSKVFEALTTAKGLAGWWTTKVTVEPGVGGVVHFHFMPGMTPNMKVTQLEQDRLVYWQCVGGHDNWINDTFSFDLSDNGEHTNVMFAQNYAREMPDAVYGMYNFNWGHYLESLKVYCETGKGMPFGPN